MKIRPGSAYRLVFGALIVAAALIVGIESSTASTSQSAKSIYQQQVAAARSKAVAAPKASKTIHPAIVPAPPAQRGQGIFDVKQGPVPSDQFQVVNSWAGPVKGRGNVWYILWAGSTGDLSVNSGVPALILQSQSPTADGSDFTNTTLGTFLLPTADGPLHVVSDADAVVTLSTPKGNLVRFNVLTRSFI